MLVGQRPRDNGQLQHRTVESRRVQRSPGHIQEIPQQTVNTEHQNQTGLHIHREEPLHVEHQTIEMIS